MKALRQGATLALLLLAACKKDEAAKPPPEAKATSIDAAPVVQVTKADVTEVPTTLLGPSSSKGSATVDTSGLKASKKKKDEKQDANQPVQDDAAFAAAVKGTMLGAYVEGGSGYYRYAYNFLADGQLLYCSYYFMTGEGGGTAEGNRVGKWEVTIGYTVPSVPGYTAGKIHIKGSDFDVTMAAEMLDAKAGVATGNASNVFHEGTFSRAVNGAVTSCSAIE